MGVVLNGNNVFFGRAEVGMSIVEDGLILYMDPNNARSYSGTGTQVNNVAPATTNNGVTGSLDDAAMYVNPSDSAAYFRVRSDSVVQRLEFSDTLSLPGSGSHTLMFYFWSDYNGNGQYGNSQAFLGGKYTNYMALVSPTSTSTTYSAEAETNGSGTPQGNHDYFALPVSESAVFTTGSWNSWTTIINDLTGSNYFNGSLGSGRLVDGANEYHLLSSTSTFSFTRLGSNSTGTGGGSRGGDIRMGALLLYNRVLTQEEITRNLLILDRRFNT